MCRRASAPFFTRSELWVHGFTSSRISRTQSDIPALMGHADEKITLHYQEGHDEKEIEYLEVGAELAF
jgi:hypothetical protein